MEVLVELLQVRTEIARLGVTDAIFVPFLDSAAVPGVDHEEVVVAVGRERHQARAAFVSETDDALSM